MNQQNNDNSIQGVLRSYGGPSHEVTEQRDQLKQRLLRSDFFVSADESTRAEQRAAFDWRALTRRLSIVAAPVMAVVLIIAIVISSTGTVSASEVLLKAAARIDETSAGEGTVLYRKYASTLSFDGVTDAYNDVLVEEWWDFANQAIRTTAHTQDGQLLSDNLSSSDGKVYESPDSIWQKTYGGDMLAAAGPLVEPNGPLDGKLALVTGPAALGGGPIESSIAASCVAGTPEEECNDVIQEEVLTDYYDPNAMGVVGARGFETDEEIIGGLYGIGLVADPEERASQLRELSNSMRISYQGEQDWNGHRVHAVKVRSWTISQRDTFYFDVETFELVGIETVSSGVYLGTNQQTSTTVYLEESSSNDTSPFSTEGLVDYQTQFLQDILENTDPGQVIINETTGLPE